jgi:hypothetical protein
MVYLGELLPLLLFYISMTTRDFTLIKLRQRIKELVMHKKLISSVLIVALINIVGCYSGREVTLNEVLANDKISEITIKTKDSLILSFEKNDFYFSNDTLKGKSYHSRIGKKIERAIPLSDIIRFESIEFDYAKTYATTMIIVIIVASIGFFILFSEHGPSQFK